MTSTQPIRVLIVDDEPSFALALEMSLNMDGFSATSVNAPEEATELLLNNTYDVVVVDYSMPGMTGLEFMQWMRDHAIDTPVMMVTAAGSETVAVEAMKAGAKNYFRKDQIDSEQLANEITAVHERTRVQLARKELEEQRRQLAEREKELASLQQFQQTVNSIGHFVENGLTGVIQKIQREGEAITSHLTDGQKERFERFLHDLKHEIELVSTGVKSMEDLSGLVSQKLEEIRGKNKTPNK